MIAAKVAELKGRRRRRSWRRIEALGGAVAAVESGYMKERLVESNARRIAAIETGEQMVVGVNKYTESAPSPLTAGGDAGFLAVDREAEAEQIARLQAWRAQRDGAGRRPRFADLEAAAHDGRNIMPASIACAHAGVTTGEWGAALRADSASIAPPPASAAPAPRRRQQQPGRGARARGAALRPARRAVKMLVGKPGLDGHSNGAEQVAVRARDCGFEVVYDGIRLTPPQIADAAVKEGVHVVGLSILSGSHVALVEEVLARLKQAGLAERARRRRRHHPAEDEAQTESRRRRPRLHAQGFRPHADHARHRRRRRPREPGGGVVVARPWTSPPTSPPSPTSFSCPSPRSSS